ncbi:MFS transporter [Bradyrhizobium sp.]|uniref:MFS transporter n=1 Tax=Bradyrhizobium sp. TaxID=376 RepID=UPI003C545E15
MPRAATKLQPFEATTGILANGAPRDEKLSAGRKSEQQPVRGWSASLTLFAMSLGYGVVQLDVTIVNTALDRIGASLGGGVAELQWIVNAYTIAFAAFILTAGALGDRIGAKRVFMAGFAIFTSASLACALSPNPMVLVAARAVQGLGAAVLVPNSLALLNHAYPDEKRRGRAIGIWAAGASLALTAGPLVGGGLIALIGWRSIFLVNLPIGLAGLWLSWKYATETSANRQRQVDRPGQVTAIAALSCLAGAIIEGGALGWSNGFVLAAFVASVVLAVLFILQERRAEQPMLPLSLFGYRLFALTALVGLLVNIAFYGLIFVFSLYFQRINGLSPVATGLAFVPMMGAVLPANLVAARVTERLGAPMTIALGAALAAFGCLTLLGIEPGTSYWKIVGQFVIMGGGLGLLVPPLTSALLGSVDKSRSGIAAGVLNATRQTGSVLGVALFGSLIGRSGQFMVGAHRSLMISTALLLVGGAVIWYGTSRRD